MIRRRSSSLACCLRQRSRPPTRSAPLQFPPVQPVTAQHGMVVAQESRAALIGAEVLKRGGNAVDAAVAVGFAMAVTYPRAGNIGGGGFMVIHLAPTGKRGRRHRLPRDRAGRDHARDLSRRPGRGRSGEVARAGLGHRRAGHGRRAGAGAAEIRLRQIQARATDRAGDRSRPQRLPGRRRVRGHRPLVDRADGALAVDREAFSQARRLADRARHAAGAVRSRQHAGRDFQARPARVLRRAGRRQDCRRGARGRRADDRATT